MSLAGMDVVMVLDDSGSMNARVDGTSNTRWDELRQITRIAVEIACSLDDDGCDLIFLNRPGANRVNSWKLAEPLFQRPPTGTTPLTKALKDAFSRQTPGKKLLVLIATDGQPNNLSAFTRALRERDPNILIGVLACSDNDRDVGYLNKLDREVPNMDVLDDFKSERKEVARVRKSWAQQYTIGNHVARLFLGPAFAKYDQLDGF